MKYKEPLPYILLTKQQVTFFDAHGTDFQQTWLTLTSDIDTTYTPALIPLPPERPVTDLELKSLLTLANLATASGADGQGLATTAPALTSLLATRESSSETLSAATMAAFGERMIKVPTHTPYPYITRYPYIIRYPTPHYPHTILSHPLLPVITLQHKKYDSEAYDKQPSHTLSHPNAPLAHIFHPHHSPAREIQC